MTPASPRILIVSPTLLEYVGGTETVVLQLARRLAGHCALTILTGTAGRHEPARPVDLPGDRIVTLPFAGRATRANRLLHRVLRLNPFVVESWSFFRSVARERFDFAGFDAILTFYERDAWLLARRHPELEARALHLLPGVSKRRILRDVGERNVVFLGYRAPERALRKWGLRIPALPLGVDDCFFPAAERAHPRTRRLVFVGRLDGSKHVDWLADLFAGSDLHARGYTLEVIGDGPLSAALQRRHGATPGLRLLGRMAPARVADHLQGAHLVLHPTDLESFGLTVLEAMAAGVPVITHALPSIRAWAGDHPAYASHLDRDAWLDAIARFEDPAVWTGTRARNAAFARGFGWGPIADRVMALLRERAAR
jgi:glycosyltransferase involved in cell wall biosynthesis